jgi:hypothetical protein
MRSDLERLGSALWSALGLVGAVLTLAGTVGFVLHSDKAPWGLCAAAVAVAAALFVHDRRLLDRQNERIAELEEATHRGRNGISQNQALNDWRRETARRAYETSRERERQDREARKKALEGLQREYVETFDGTEKVTPAIRAGTTRPPRDWMKSRLTEMSPERSLHWLFHDYFREEIEAQMYRARQAAEERQR